MNKELAAKVQKVRELSNRVSSLENMRKDVDLMTEIRMWSSQDHIDRCSTVSARDGEIFKDIKNSIKYHILGDITRCQEELSELFNPQTDIGPIRF